MKAPRTVVLQPRRRGATPDPVLDAAIAKHKARTSARLAMVAPTAHARAVMGRHMLNRYTNTTKRGFRS